MLDFIKTPANLQVGQSVGVSVTCTSILFFDQTGFFLSSQRLSLLIMLGFTTPAAVAVLKVDE